MPEKIENLLVPNKQMMLQHLEFLFGDCRVHDDGRIEIAYTDTRGKPNQAKYFDVTDMEAAAEFAADQNQKSGINVYVGGALRLPDTAPFGRSSLNDYYAAPAAWVDIDDPGMVEAAKDRYKSMPPSLVIVTGREPHTRAQLWWKLMHFEDSADDLKTCLAGLQSSFDGDPAVVDPARIMRLGGTIAWPYKEGRVVELTQVAVPEKNTKLIMIDKLAAIYKGQSTVTTRPQHQNNAPAANPTAATRNRITGKIDISRSLELSQQPGHWWHSVRDAVAAMVGKGWSNEAIELACQPFKWPDYKQSDHDKEILKLISSARKKYGRPEPSDAQPEYDPETGEVIGEKPIELRATSLDDIDLDNIPPREFLYETIIGRKYVTMIVAPPGAGKSMFTMQMAISAAANKSWGAWKPSKSNLNVWVYNNEEGQDELYRRIKAVMVHNELAKSDFKGQFFIDSGESKSISIANVSENIVVHTPDYDALLAEVINRKIDVLIVDPFAETHSVMENSNEQIKDVVRLYRDIAFKANCAVLLVHHTRKGATESAGDADSARGGGAQIGVVRRMFTLSAMTKNEADKMGVPAEKRRWFVRFDDAKTNITAPAETANWFKFCSVAINNGRGIYPEGDKVGVLDHINIEDISSEFSEEMGDKQVEILTIMVEMMDSANVTMTTVPEIIEYIKSFSSIRLSDRSLRDMVKDAAAKHPRNRPFMIDGTGHYFSVNKGSGGKNNAISITKKRINSDF